MTKMTDCFQSMEIWTDSGSTKIQTMTAHEIYQNTQWVTQERWSTIAPLMGTTSSWGSPTAISAGARKTFMLPIIGSWFDFTEPFMQSVKADIVVRFNFRNAVSAGTGVLAASGLQLIFDQDHGPAEDQKRISQMYNDNVMRNFFFDTQWVSATANFSANVTTNISLRSVTGKAVFFTFGLRYTDVPTSEGYSAYSAIEPTSEVGGTIALVDAQQKSILGGGVIQIANCDTLIM